MAIVLNKTIQKSMLDTLVDTGNVLDPAEMSVGLFQQNIAVTDSLTLDQVTEAEADFSGYAKVTPITLNVTNLNNANNWSKLADPCVFTHNGGATNNTIYGWFMQSGLSTIVMAEPFVEPEVMAVDGDSIRVAPELQIDASGNFGKGYNVG